MLGAALQGADPDRGGVDVVGAEREDLGDAGAGVSRGEGEGQVGGLRGAGGGREEAGALVRGEVFAAAGVDQADGLGVRHLC